MPLTIKTRYRDIPYEEIGHAGNIGDQIDEGGASWNEWRGRPVEIEIPPVQQEEIKSDLTHCKQPMFRIVDRGVRTDVAVCACMVEIGD